MHKFKMVSPIRMDVVVEATSPDEAARVCYHEYSQITDIPEGLFEIVDLDAGDVYEYRKRKHHRIKQFGGEKDAKKTANSPGKSIGHRGQAPASPTAVSGVKHVSNAQTKQDVMTAKKSVTGNVRPSPTSRGVKDDADEYEDVDVDVSIFDPSGKSGVKGFVAKPQSQPMELPSPPGLAVPDDAKDPELVRIVDEMVTMRLEGINSRMDRVEESLRDEMQRMGARVTKIAEAKVQKKQSTLLEPIMGRDGSDRGVAIQGQAMRRYNAIGSSTSSSKKAAGGMCTIM